MAQMVGLCNVCDTIGAKDWKDIDDTINALLQEISDVQEAFVDCKQQYEAAEESADKVVMVDITDEEMRNIHKVDSGTLTNSPILLIPVHKYYRLRL